MILNAGMRELNPMLGNFRRTLAVEAVEASLHQEPLVSSSTNAASVDRWAAPFTGSVRDHYLSFKLQDVAPANVESETAMSTSVLW